MYDLSALTEQQKQDYVVALCEHLEIPPELNLVRLIWDDDGSTSRKQVAYVLKGGTDIIRANRKITTKSLTNVDARRCGCLYLHRRRCEWAAGDCGRF